ncbi:hypothetical protein CCACVL1_07562, partial [Corchorus capsularis]
DRNIFYDLRSSTIGLGRGSFGFRE